MAKAGEEWIYERIKNQLMRTRASLMKLDKVEHELAGDSSMTDELRAAILKATGAWWECM